MSFKFPSHLRRNRHGVLHFRLTIPDDLRQHFASREIYRSLRTASARQAADDAQTLYAAFKRLFSELRQQSVSDNKDRPKTTPSDTVWGLIPDTSTDNEDRPNLRMESETGSAGAVGSLKVKLITEIDVNEQGKPVVRFKDEPGDTPDAQARAIEAYMRNLAPSAPIKPTGPLLSAVVEDFICEKHTQKDWTEKTEAEYRAAYALFVRIVGDIPIADIDDRTITGYSATLQKLPPNLNRTRAYVNKHIDDIIAMSPVPMKSRTINKNIERVSSLFKWAAPKKRYGVACNPAFGLTIKEDDTDEVMPFDTSELATLFRATDFVARKFQNPYAYWLMPLALLTGARLNEICQLYLADFVDYDGVSCIEITDELEGQRVKNKSSKRLVPVHEKLSELGLQEYVDWLRKKGEVRLFPELTQRRDGFGQAASNWFQRFKKRCGIVGGRTKVFHSFRHTFISALLNDEVPEQSVAQIVGHEAKLTTGKIYWNAKDAAKRKPTINAYQPPPEVWALIPKFEDVTITRRCGPKAPRSTIKASTEMKHKQAAGTKQTK